MSSRRDHPTHATGAHRAHSVRRQKQDQRSGLAKAFSGAGASRKAAANDGPWSAGSAAAEDPERTADAARTAGVTAGATPMAAEAAAHGRSTDQGTAAVGARDEGGVLTVGRQGRGMARYERYLDGLFTYCLSVMCEHDAAITAVGEALVLAERQHERDRAPVRHSLHRPWLYALARWVCLRRLAEQNSGTVPATAPHLTEAARTQRRRDLAALAWPEAAGTTPEQREALELAVRHGLPAHEVAAVLSVSAEAASALLSQAACEVERTRAALAVVKSGGCRVVSGLAGEDQLLLGPAFRRELVKHVDECTHCRRSAERAMSGVAWPGTAPAGTAVLAVLEAPRPAVEAAVLAVRRARCRHTPRFDRTGFPVEVKDRSARRDKLRSRAVTTTVVATVVAAPVLALWAAYRGAPLTGESEGSTVSSGRDDESAMRGQPFENAAQDGKRSRDDRKRHGKDPGSRGKHGREGSGSDGRHAEGEDKRAKGAGRLSVDARPVGGATLIRLTANGGSAVRWSMSGGAPWLALSRTSGVLRPGESTTVRVTVVRGREPAGAWSAHLRVAPSGAVVTIQGRGSGSTSPTPPSDEPTKPPSDEPTTPPPSNEPTTPPSDPPGSGDPTSSPR